MFFVQMPGFPGSGKSTLARQISRRTGAVVIDHDITKSALLNSIKKIPVNPKLAGKIGYDIDWAYVDFYLSQGHHVILDSPCLYTEMVEKGTHLCAKYGAKYKYVECVLDDFDETNNRLRNRESKISQIKEIQSEEAFQSTIKNSKKPQGHNCLTVDTSRPVDHYIQDVLNYISE